MKQKPRIVIRARHSGEVINQDGRSHGDVSKEEEENGEASLTGAINPEPTNESENNAIDEFNTLKSIFYSELKKLPFRMAKDFLTKRLMRREDFDNINSYIDVLDSSLTNINAVQFAVTELRDFVQAESSTSSPSNNGSESDVNDDDTDEELYPDSDLSPENYSENFEDFSDNPFGDQGMEGFMRESSKKMIDLLNEILIRLKRLEERADLQKEVNTNNITKFEEVDKSIDLVNQKVDALPPFIKQTVEEIFTANIPTTLSSEPNEFVIKELGEVRRIKGVFPKTWPEMLELGSTRKNIMLVGATGCGKSFIAERLAEALNLKFYSMSCSEGMSESEGKGWLLPLGDNGKFVYLPSGFVIAYEEGGLFNADEFDAIDPNVGTWFNKALAGDSFYLPMRKENSIVKRHKDFLWVACANTFGTGATTLYTGRNQLDGATLDRHLIGTVVMDYDAKVEAAIIDPQILLWGQIMRKAMTQLSMDSKPCSTRFLVDSTHMLKAYPKRWTLKKIEEKFFTNWETDDIKRTKTVVKDIVTKELGGEEK